MCVLVCEGTSVDLKDEGFGEHCQAMSLISVSTEKCRAKQCTASRLLMDTSDYPGTEQERAGVQERWMQR